MLGKSIALTESFESMKMLIATDVFTRIEEEILLTLEDEGHRVIVREIATTFQQYISGILNQTPGNKYICDPPGFEDIEDGHSEQNSSNIQNNGLFRSSKEFEAAQETPEEDTNSNLIL